MYFVVSQQVKCYNLLIGMLKSIFYLFLGIFLISECECEKDSLTDYDGIGGIICEVNSKSFKSFDGIGRNNNSRLIDYNDSMGLLISYRGSVNDTTAYVSILLADINPNEMIGRTFILELQEDTTGYTGNSGASFSKLYTTYRTSTEKAGELKIDFFDFEERIASGTFRFVAEDYNGDTVFVENGFFDCSFY